MFKCPNDPEHEIFIVFPGVEDEDPDGLGVQVDAEGVPNGAWGDGVRGIPDALRELAEDETMAVCAFCVNERRGEAIEWVREATDE